MGANRNKEMKLIKSSDKWWNIVLIIHLNVFLWAPLFHYLMPLSIFGFSAFNTVIPTFVLFSVFILLSYRYTKVEWEIAVAILILFFFYYGIQKLLGITNANILQYYVINRYIFNIFFAIIILNHVNLQPYRRMYYFSLLSSFLFANITSALFLMRLPTFRILDESLTIYEIGRFGGIWGAPNGFAYLMALVCFALLTCGRFSVIFKATIYFISVFGWIAAGSRMCALFYILMLPFVFISLDIYKKFITKYITTLAISAAVFTIVLFTTGFGNTLLDLGGAFSRMTEYSAGEDIRFQKNSFFFGKLFDSPQSFFLGIPIEEQGSGVIEFSDNGILLFILNLGVSFFIVYSLFMFRLMFNRVFSRNLKNPIFFILIIIISTTFFVNNATIWDNYIFISLLIVYLYTGYLDNKRLKPQSVIKAK